jgi:hypothetical protein
VGIEKKESDSPGLTQQGLREFRKDERKQMIEILHDLIEESGKRAKSQYTPARERTKWVKLTGQLIWYKDHVLRNYDYETIRAEMDELRDQLNKGEEERKKALMPVLPPMREWGKPETETVEEKKPEDKSENQQSETAEEDRLYPESE